MSHSASSLLLPRFPMDVPHLWRVAHNSNALVQAAGSVVEPSEDARESVVGYGEEFGVLGCFRDHLPLCVPTYPSSRAAC